MDEDEQRIRATLRPSERLLWHGRPDPSVLFTKADALLVPFSVIYFGFILYVIFGAPARGQGVILIVEIILAIIGFYYLLLRFIVKLVQKRRTLYALTDTRALVLVGPSSEQGVTLPAQPVAVTKSRDGEHISVTIGTLAGRRTTNMYANTGLDFMSRNPGQVAFYDVADVAGLEAALAAAGPTAG